MNIEIKISKRPISYTKAINFMNKRVDDLKKNYYLSKKMYREFQYSLSFFFF